MASLEQKISPIDHQKQVAYISADDRHSRMADRTDALGAIYRLDLNDLSGKPQLMAREPDTPIAPHGISLLKSNEGKDYLYVIDHIQGSHRILLYAISGGNQLKLVNTFQDAQFLISPNDIVAVNQQSFYFTNDHGSHGKLGRMFEDYLQLSRSNVVFCNQGQYSIAADGIAYANGINLSADGKRLYVASPIGKCVLEFQRDPVTGRLTDRQVTNYGTGVDNIELDEHGNLWVGCHPKLLSFIRHAGDSSRPSPSQVLRVGQTSDQRLEAEAEEIYLDEGKQISASSVAAVSGRHLLIGPVFDKKILWCQLPE
jgi:arylesterase/paraoxonase